MCHFQPTAGIVLRFTRGRCRALPFALARLSCILYWCCNSVFSSVNKSLVRLTSLKFWIWGQFHLFFRKTISDIFIGNFWVMTTITHIVYKQRISFHLARDSIYAIARSLPMPVRLSLCLSHRWISQRRFMIGSRNLHHRVAPDAERHPEIPTPNTRAVWKNVLSATAAIVFRFTRRHCYRALTLALAGPSCIYLWTVKCCKISQSYHN